ncbi:MAG: chitobiase/beta-hexosaminidase C-terminal domain-containing protein, partial [Propionibacteriaceae bacterium]|nr:chitobiase/beta-hexosaminidase C-terminal domain-containing protein [Propionibacteriaceae bacterium]
MALAATSVTVSAGSAQAEPTPSTHTITVPIATRNDDAEERGTGQSVTLEASMQIGGYSSNTLTAANKQLSGFRFAGVQLPANAELDDAYIEFTVQSTGRAGHFSDISFSGELGNAAPYTSAAGAISARPYGQERASARLYSFTKAGDKARTPNLSRLIDENRILGWESGQALAFAISGTDNIGAVYPGGNARHASLVINYHDGAGANLDGVTNLVRYSVTPSAGAYDTAQNVVINCDAPGQITYTLDGSDPAPGVGTVYTAPITIGPGRTQLKVYIAGGIRDSGVLRYNYIVGAESKGGLITVSSAIQTGADDAFATLENVELSTLQLPLHSKYLSTSGYQSYLRFTDVDLPVDAVVESAKLSFTTSAAVPEGGRIEVAGETSARGGFASAPGRFVGREWTQPVTLSTPKLSSGQTYTTGDLSAVVTEQLSANAEREDYVFKIRGLTPEKALNVRSFNYSAKAAPKLEISYYSNYAHSVTAVASSSDDAEETGTAGKVSLTGSLSLGGYSRAQATAANRAITGVRFASVKIPEKATLVDAYVEFTTAAKGPSGQVSALSIKAESGDAGVYRTVANNITGRSYSIGKLSWQAAALNQTDAKVRTPNLRDLIDEIRLGGWKDGSALAFKFDGDGYIGSVDSGTVSTAPLLYLEYRFDGKGAWENVVTDPALLSDVYINELSTSGTAANEDDW